MVKDAPSFGFRRGVGHRTNENLLRQAIRNLRALSPPGDGFSGAGENLSEPPESKTALEWFSWRRMGLYLQPPEGGELIPVNRPWQMATTWTAVNTRSSTSISRSGMS